MGDILTPLPKRRHGSVVILKEYFYSQLIESNIDFSTISYIIISKNDLNNNFDLLKRIIKENKKIGIKFLDWDSVVYMDQIEELHHVDCFLVDDTLRVNRDYIDTTKLKNIDIIIPLHYLMWGIKFQSEIKTYCFQNQNVEGNFIHLTSSNADMKLTKQELLRIKEIASLLQSYGPNTDIEKVLLVSDFIQSQTQFIEGYENESIRGTFITPDFPKDYTAAAYVSSTLNHHGKCMAISTLSTLLLNNPELNVEVESVRGCSHGWNKVLIDGKYYYFDNTWDITRTDTPHEDGLITLSFSNKFNFIGSRTAMQIGHHIAESLFVYRNGVFSEEDFRQYEYISKFRYPTEPFFKSYKKTN